MHMTVLHIGSKSSLSITHNKHKKLTLYFLLILTKSKYNSTNKYICIKLFYNLNEILIETHFAQYIFIHYIISVTVTSHPTIALHI